MVNLQFTFFALLRGSTRNLALKTADLFSQVSKPAFYRCLARKLPRTSRKKIIMEMERIPVSHDYKLPFFFLKVAINIANFKKMSLSAHKGTIWNMINKGEISLSNATY